MFPEPSSCVRAELILVDYSMVNRAEHINILAALRRSVMSPQSQL